MSNPLIKRTREFWVFVLCISIPVMAKAQKTVQGFITDSTTHKPIPFVSILQGTNGTVTNSDGEFIITVNQFPVNLNISHLNYQNKVVSITTNSVNIALLETPQTLDEVTISDLGLKIMQKLYQKLITQKFKIAASGFYRQTIVNNKTCTEIFESFNDLTFNNQGLLKYKINNARYGIQKEEKNELFLKYSNFSYLIYGFKPFSYSRYNTIGKSIGIPLMPNADQYYTYQVLGIKVKENEQIVEIYCTPTNPNLPFFEGRYYVNRSSLEIVKIAGFIKNDLGATLNNLAGKIQNTIYGIEMNYLKIDNKLVPNYIEIKMNSDFTNQKSGETFPTEVKGILTVYNFEEGKRSGKGKAVSIKTNDLRQVKNSKYDPQFWVDNPIVKRTPLEEHSIANFEKNKFFGTYSVPK